MLAEAEVDVEDQAILWKLEQFSALVFGRDRSLANELWSDLGFSLVGPEFGDETHTRAELVTRLEEIFELPMRLSFGWTDVKVLRERDIAWAIADCRPRPHLSRHRGVHAPPGDLHLPARRRALALAAVQQHGDALRRARRPETSQHH